MHHAMDPVKESNLLHVIVMLSESAAQLDVERFHQGSFVLVESRRRPKRRKGISMHHHRHMPCGVVKAGGASLAAHKAKALEHIRIVLFPEGAGVPGTVGASQEAPEGPRGQAELLGRSDRIWQPEGESIPEVEWRHTMPDRCCDSPPWQRTGT